MREIGGWTALRGLLALWIVLHHFWPQTSAPVPGWVARGTLAVDLFFVLSGAVMWHVYGPALAAGRFSVRDFAAKRFARLYPLHAVTAVAAFAMLTLGPWLGIAGRTPQTDPAAMLALHLGLLHAWGITPTGGLNYPSWSVAAEAFAYALFPLIALGLCRASPRAGAAAAALGLVLAALVLQAAWPEEWRRAGEPWVLTRLENDFGALRILPAFALGVALQRLTLSSLAAHRILPPALAAMAVAMSTGHDPAFILAGAVVIRALAACAWRVAAPLGRLGRISYGLYMTHALVQIAGFKLIERIGGYRDDAVPVAWLAVMLPLAIAVGWLAEARIETPLRRWILRPRPAAPAARPDAQPIGPS